MYTTQAPPKRGHLGQFCRDPIHDFNENTDFSLAPTFRGSIASPPTPTLFPYLLPASRIKWHNYNLKPEPNHNLPGMHSALPRGPTDLRVVPSAQPSWLVTAHEVSGTEWGEGRGWGGREEILIDMKVSRTEWGEGRGRERLGGEGRNRNINQHESIRN